MVRRAAAWTWRQRHIVPLTPLGVGLAALGFWLSHSIGKQQVDYVLRSAGLMAIGAVALALVLVLLASLRIGLTLRRLGEETEQGLQLETGLTAATGLRLPALRRWPLVQLTVVWEDPAEVEASLVRRGGWAEEMVRPLLRGQTSRVRRRLLVADIFGFARLGLPLTTDQTLRVTPSRARVTAHVVTRFLGGDALSHPSGPSEGEMIEMRRYVYGDPLRHVLWKAFARTRKLLVRTPERAITPRPSAAAYMVSGAADEPAASAARFFIEEGMLGQEFVFCADGSTTPTGDAAEAVDQIVLSARFRREGAEGLPRFLGHLSPRQLEALVLFVPAAPGPWLERVARVAGRLPGVRAITAVDARCELRAGRLRSLRRLLFTEAGDTPLVVRRLGKVVHRLGEAGFAVHVLHRPTGEFLGRAQLEALAGVVER
jgi:hypothetical protein